MKTKPILFSAGIILMLLCILSYISAPSTATFELSSLNPASILAGISFLFSFGFGFPVYISIGIVLLLLIAAILLLAKLIQKIQSKN
ncbi:MAG: hypothetical protein ACRCZQ_01465 [Bacteroidales bacterium]